MSDIILSAKGITKKFGGLIAVNDMNIDIKRGTRHALIGPNGSGKTTMVNVITGFYIPEQGSLSFNGNDITKTKPFDRTKMGLGRTFQNIRLSDDMSVRENIALGSHCRTGYNIFDVLRNSKRYKAEEREIKERTEFWAEQLKITNLLDLRVSSVPYGEQKIIEIARALMMKPEILLLDEPAAGMNNAEVLRLGEILRSITEQNITIFLIEHNMSFISDIADKVTVMQEGRKIAEGDFKTVSEDPAVIESYLGKGVKRHA